jgi:hypothetical protein
MVEVFKTNIQDVQIADFIVGELEKIFPNAAINFDLNDCDNILRIDHHENVIDKVLLLFENLGHFCELLAD